MNDLKDWHENSDNKGEAGGDVLGGRPTVLWAFALESLKDELREELLSLVEPDNPLVPEKRIERVRQLYHEAGVFEKARQLVDKYRLRIEEIADGVRPDALRSLLLYLVETVLEEPGEEVMPTIEFNNPTLSQALPVIGQ